MTFARTTAVALLSAVAGLGILSGCSHDDHHSHRDRWDDRRVEPAGYRIDRHDRYDRDDWRRDHDRDDWRHDRH